MWLMYLKFCRLGKKTLRKNESCFTSCDVYVNAALIVHAGFGSAKVWLNAQSLFLSETGKEKRNEKSIIKCTIAEI